jgi:ATP-binding cassette subfamily B protein
MDLVPIDNAEESNNDAIIEFKNVCFSYNKKRDDLHDISFTLEKGQSLGILGPTGSGKSTLATLLLRFYDVDSGNIFVNGKDVRSYSHSELRQKFGVVFQNDMVFNDSISGNIKLWRNVEPDALNLATQVAQAEFIEKAGGFDAEVSARGTNLSGGQKQRLLIARALAGKPDILILDDSSSALDYKTDAALRAQINEHFSDTTTVIIAQRVSSIRSCDKILVLDSGKELGFGTHEQLLESCELYREIYSLQMGEGENA